MRSGDIVRHKPTDALQTLAYVDDDEAVSVSETLVRWRTADIELVKEASDEEHVRALRAWCAPPAVREDGSPDGRAAVCARQLALFRKKLVLAGRGGEYLKWCEPSEPPSVFAPAEPIDADEVRDAVPNGYTERLVEAVAKWPDTEPEPEEVTLRDHTLDDPTSGVSSQNDHTLQGVAADDATPDEIAKARAKRSLAAMFPPEPLPDPFEREVATEALALLDNTSALDPVLDADDLLDPTTVVDIDGQFDPDVDPEEDPPEESLYRCGTKKCAHKAVKAWKGPCPVCYGWETPKKRKKEVEGGSGSGSGSAAALVEKYKNSAGKRISTGIPELDHVMGGGFRVGSSILLAGEPGAGKSTLCMRVCEHVSKTLKRPTLYASAEEADADLAEMLVRLNITDPRVQIRGNEGDLWKTRDVIEAMKPALVVIDSLPKFTMEDVGGNEGSTEQIKSITDNLTYYGKKNKTMFIFIMHFTSSGEVAGGLAAQHVGDGTITLKRLGNLHNNYDPETGEIDERVRILQIGKNRLGPEGAMSFLVMEQDGSGLSSLDPDSPIGKPNRRVTLT